jgi:hypothetical protein
MVAIAILMSRILMGINIFIDKATTGPASVELATPRRGLAKRRYRRVSKIPIGCGWEQSGPTAFRGVEKIACESIAIPSTHGKAAGWTGPIARVTRMPAAHDRISAERRNKTRSLS